MTMKAANSNPNPSLQKKTAARTAAVQCLYMLEVSGEALDPATQVDALKEQLANNRDEQKLRAGMAVEPNYALLARLLEGVAQWKPDIDTRLDGALSGEWKRDRMSPLLIAILQCAIFEMCFDKDMNHKIVIDEYSRITRSFFADGEVDFVHAALSKLARQH